MKTILYFFLALTLTTVGLAQAQPQKLLVAYSTTASGPAVAWVAKDAGFFDKNGLDVSFIFIGGSGVMTQALVGGSVQIAVGGGSAAVASSLAGIDLVMTSSLIHKPVLRYLVTRKEITRPEQLKGKTLGISRFGSSSNMLLRLTLKKIGLDPQRDVAVLQVGSAPLRVGALKTGSIDGSLMSMGERVLTDEAGFPVLFDLADLGIEVLQADVIASRTFLRNQEEVMKRFTKAIVEAIHYGKRQKREAMEILSRYMKTKDARVLEASYDASITLAPEKPYPTLKGVEVALAELAVKNPKAAGAKPEQFVDMRFVKELDQGGYIDSLYSR